MRQFFLLLLCATLRIDALYQGNPALPAIIDKGLFLSDTSPITLRIGYQHDEIFDRQIEMRNGSKKRIHRFSQSYDQAMVTCDVMSRVELFGNLGGMQLSLIEGSINRECARLHSRYQFTGGGGIRASIINWEKSTLGANVSFQWARPEIEQREKRKVHFSSDERIQFSEWQVGGALGHQIKMFIPYIGVNYSKTRTSAPPTPLTSERASFKSRSYWGVALGCDLSTEDYFDLGFEVRLLAENSLTLRGDLQF